MAVGKAKVEFEGDFADLEKEISSAFKKLGADAGQAASEGTKKGTDAAKKAAADAASDVKKSGDAAADSFDGVGDAAAAAATAASGEMSEMAGEVTNSAKKAGEGAASGFKGVGDAAAREGTRASDAMGDMAASTGRAGRDAGERGASGFQAIGDAARGAATSAAASLEGMVGAAGRSGRSAGEAAASGFASVGRAAQNAAASTTSAFSNLGSTISAQLSSAGAAARQAGADVRAGLAKALDESKGIALEIPPAIKSIGLAAAALAGPMAILKGGFDRLMTLDKAAIMFKNIGLSAGEIESQMASLNDVVTGTSLSMADATSAASMLMQAGVEAGKPIDDSIRAMANMAAISGGAADEIGMVMMQIKASGKLLGGDAMQLQGRGVNIYGYLAESLGKSFAEVKKMGEDGQITYEMVVDAVNAKTGELAKEMGETLPAKIANLKTAFSNLGATIIAPFIPAITKMVEFGITIVKALVAPMKSVISFFQSGSVAANILGTAIKVVLTGAFIALGAAAVATIATMLMMGQVPALFLPVIAVVKTLTLVFGRLRLGLQLAAAATRGLAVALFTTPVGWIVLGIAAIVAAVVLLWKHSEAFRNFWVDVWHKIADPVVAAVDAVKAAWGGLVGIFRGEESEEGRSALARLIGVDRVDWIISTITTVKGVWADLKTAFGGGEVEGGGALARLVGIETAERVMEVIGSIKIAWGELWDAFQGGDSGYGALSTLLGDEGRAEFVANLFARMGEGARLVWDSIKQVGQALADVGASIASAGWDAITSVFSALAEVGKSLWDALVQIGSAVWDLVQALAPVLMPVLKVLGAIIGGVIVAGFFLLIGALQIVSGIFQVLGAVISWLSENVLSPLIGIIGEVVGWLVEKLGGAVAGLVDIVTGVISGVGELLGAIWEGLQVAWDTVGQPVLDFILGAFNFWWESVKLGFRLLGAVFEVIWTGLQMAWEAVGQPVLDWIVQKFNDMWTGLQIVFGWLQAGWDFLWNAVVGVYNAIIAPVVSWIVDRFNDLRVKVEVALYLVKGAIQGAADKVSQFYDQYVRPMVDRVIRGFNRIKDTVMGWKDSLVDAVSDAGSWLVDAGRNVVQGFIDGIKSLAGTIGSAFLDMVPGWIKGPFKEALGIHSPSTVFAEYGRNIGEGLVEGVESMQGAVAGATGELADAAAFPTLSVPDMPAAPAMPVAAPVPVVSGESAELAGESFAQVVDAFASMAESMSGTATGVLDPMWAAQNAQFVGLGVTTQAQANSVIVPTWQRMASNMQMTQVGVIAPTLAAMNAAVMQTASLFYQQITAVITPALQYLVTVLFWVLNSGVNPVFAAMRGGLQTVVGAFANAVAAITTQWEQVREATARPVRFTIQSVFNDGLVGMWNSVADLLGTKKMGTYPVRFASGGILPGYTPGRDPYTFVEPNTGMSIGLSGGEAIMRPEVARAMGGSWVDGVNAAARTGGPTAVQRYLGGYRAGGVVESITGLVRRFWPMMTITSTYRNTRDHHGGGRAVDFSNGRDSTPAMRSATSWFAKNYQPALLELIHSPSPFNIKNGRNVGNGFGTYGAGTMAQHRNHVHVAASRPLPAPGGALASIPGDPGMGDFDIAGAFTQEWKDKIASALKGYRKGSGLIDTWPEAISAKLTKAADDKIEKLFMELGGDPGGEGVERWRPLAMQALARHGYNPAQHINAMMKQIQIESGGNPRAINLWDSNAAKGTPSGGLLQVIEPTYRSVRSLYPSAFKGLPDDRFHPLTNLTAGVGAVRRDWGGPAGRWPTTGGYHLGGMLPGGEGWFHKTALEPERILSPRQTVAFEGLVHALDRSVDGGFNLSRVEESPLSSQRTLALTQNIYGGSSEETAEKVVDNLAKVAW